MNAPVQLKFSVHKVQNSLLGGIAFFTVNMSSHANEPVPDHPSQACLLEDPVERQLTLTIPLPQCTPTDNVHISPNGSIITIVGARPSNHGAYRCVASNAYGVAQSVVNLSVHGKRFQPTALPPLASPASPGSQSAPSAAHPVSQFSHTWYSAVGSDVTQNSGCHLSLRAPHGVCAP